MFTPISQSFICMGGIDLLWPLADIIFMFSNEHTIKIHELIHELIAQFITLQKVYPNLGEYQTQVCKIDQFIEGYCRKYINLQMKKAVSKGFEVNFSQLFFKDYPFMLKLDILHILYTKIFERNKSKMINSIEIQIVDQILQDTDLDQRASELIDMDVTLHSLEMRPDDVAPDALEDNSENYISNYTKNIQDVCISEV